MNPHPTSCSYKNICPGYLEDGSDHNCTKTNGGHCSLAHFLDDEGNRNLVSRLHLSPNKSERLSENSPTSQQVQTGSDTKPKVFQMACHDYSQIGEPSKGGYAV
jgi:hypothetical protein